MLPAQRLVLELAGALHRRGTAAHRLEDTLESLARTLGLTTHVFCTPTSVQLAFERDGHQQTHMLRVRPAEPDLGKLARIDGLLGDVETGQATVATARMRLAEIEAAPARPGVVGTALAGGVTSGAAAVFFGGGSNELVCATLFGAGVVIVAHALGASRDASRVYEPLAAFLTSLGAWLLASRVGVAPEIICVSALIMLVPGLGVTIAVTELASGHVVSGTARLAGAGTLFLSIAFGVALGQAVATAMVGPTPIAAASPLPDHAWLVALAVAPLSFVPLFRAEARDTPWIWIAGVVAFLGARVGGQLLGPELGVFLGALAVGTLGNLYARLSSRPASILRLPGILLLVPGSTGFRSLGSFLAEDPLAGAEGAFRVVLVAMGLVAGLLCANLLLPPRRPL